MTLTFKRSSLVAQVADAIRAEILANPERKWLPTERELSSTLHVSRNTCRKALQVLGREQLITPVQGLGIRVNRDAVRRARSRGRQPHSVGIIIPDIISRLRPQISLAIENLRDELSDLGVHVRLHHNPGYYRPKPRAALEQLIGKSPHDCWVMFCSPEPMQRWFMQKEIPCVVDGSVYPGIRLPSVDQNFRAICRHAAGKLISLGHRRLAFFSRQQHNAGDLESEAGFLEGVAHSSHPGVEAQIVLHDDTRSHVIQLVDRMFASPRPPTGLLIANSYCYLAVVTALAQRRLRVPDDVSLISREDDPYLAYVEPEPARYLENHLATTHKVMAMLRQLLEGRAANLEPVRLFPRFASGGSCCRV